MSASRKYQRKKLSKPIKKPNFKYASENLLNEFNLGPRKKSPRSTTLTINEELELNDHLIELWVVLRNIAKTVLIVTLIIMVLPGFKNGVITYNPYKPFILQLLNSIIAFSLRSFSNGNNIQIFVGSPLTPISLYLNLTLFIGVIVSLPVTYKELIDFIKPALTENEYAILTRLTRVSALLFILGASISYFIIIPVTLRILAISGGIVGQGALLQMYSIDSVLNLLLWGTLGGGILYASPVILLALLNLDMITADQIASKRKEMIFIIFLIAAIVTPDPTIVSMLILSTPMIFIIEFIISWGYRIELEKLVYS